MANLDFRNIYDYDITVGVDASSPGGASVIVYYALGVAFGEPLSPQNTPVNIDQFNMPLPNSVWLTLAGGTEELTFTIDRAAR